MLLRALVGSSERFLDMLPTGYEYRDIRWVIQIDPATGTPDLRGPFDHGEIRKSVPVRSDRTNSSKPSLFADTAEYALGIMSSKGGTASSVKHRDFVALTGRADDKLGDVETKAILRFLKVSWAGVRSSPKGADDGLRKFAIKAQRVGPGDMVALRASTVDLFAFERADVQAFWEGYLQGEYSGREGVCCLCGQSKPILRILHGQITLFKKYRCPISSFNKDKTAFNSFGKEQTANSPYCFACASKANSVLRFLTTSARHSYVLTQDRSKGEGKAPLRNQLAVFWLKHDTHQTARHSGGTIDLESLLKAPLDAKPLPAPPPAEVGQIRSLLSMPWNPELGALRLDDNRFYLAVLSPNMTRLVVREWAEESIGTVVERMSVFVDAASIVNSEGTEVVFTTIPTMLEALKPWKSQNGGIDSNLARGLLRTAYRGLPPPEELLDLAVQRFRVSDRPANRKEEEDLKARRTVLAAAMKLVITYGQQEAIALQTLNTSGRSNAHLSGQLLAVLEEAQMRASGWRINSTLVDRYYGAASTAPGTVLGQLLNQTTKSHMPKLRKEGRGYEALEELLEGALSQLDERGGFPGTLTLREQAEFALGFYHQRAHFRSNRPGLQDLGEAQQGGQTK